MLKFFFNKESWAVYVTEGLGVLTLLALIVSWWPGGQAVIWQILFFLYVLEYLFIRFFSTFRWYDDDGRNTFRWQWIWDKKDVSAENKYEGIEVHLKKSMVPPSYILPLFNILLLAGAPGAILIFPVVFLTIIAHVNVILIYFHIKDKETLPVNFFTHNKHLI